MSHDYVSRNPSFPAPCIVDSGTVVDKRDIQRVLSDLTRVRYIHMQDGQVASEGEGCVLEVFADPHKATLIANHTLYLNVYSFDYLELSRSADHVACFDLIQEERQLRLIPLSHPLQDQGTRNLNAADLEAVVAEVLSANWDVQIDDEDEFSF
jgi:hypothetical protein